MSLFQRSLISDGSVYCVTGDDFECTPSNTKRRRIFSMPREKAWHNARDQFAKNFPDEAAFFAD
eukprot:5621177-Lingulodinium_polyedra.AAC.1